MSLDFSVSLGNILTIASFLVGGVIFVLTIKSDVRNISTRLEESSDRSNAEIGDLKMDIKELNKMTVALGTIAVAMEASNGRFNLLDERLTAQGKRLDDAIAQMRDLNK